MSVSNNNWVCFKCRLVKRQPKAVQNIPICILCKDKMYNLGYKVSIPKQKDKKAWKNLRETFYQRKIGFEQYQFIRAINCKHQIEKEITHFEQLKPNKGNRKRIQTLKKKLNKIVYNNL